MTLVARDEEDRLPRALESVRFADEVVVVVDAASADRTAEVARSLGARVVVEPWGGFGTQKNLAAGLARGPWILSLDADEAVTPALAREISGRLARSREAPGEPVAFRLPIALEFLGRELRFGRDAVVKRVRLYDKRHARFSDDAVHERVLVDGPVGRLSGTVRHLSYRDLGHYLGKLDLYTTLAAGAKASAGRGAPRFLLPRVLWELFDRAVLHLGVLDGVAGLTYAALSAGNALVKYEKLRELETGVRLGAEIR